MFRFIANFRAAAWVCVPITILVGGDEAQQGIQLVHQLLGATQIKNGLPLFRRRLLP